MLQIALLDDLARPEIESQFIDSFFNIAQAYELDHLDNYRQVYGLSVRPLLNKCFYASLGEKRAFLIGHSRNLSVLKIVGYAEDVLEYYRLADQTAHVWISHQRYLTKGRVWHPGGAHPFHPPGRLAHAAIYQGIHCF